MKLVQLSRYTGAAAVVLFISTPIWAAGITPAEIAMLPAYCDAKMGSRSPDAVSYWETRLGHENWIHMHHYCGGLNEMNHYYRQSGATERQGSLGRAIWQFDYVLKYTSPAFYMRAEAHYNRGKALKLEGKDGPALSDFSKALELSPGMPAASIELAALYKKMNKKEQALEVLKLALEKNPAHKGLRRSFQEFGGNLADIAATPAPPATANPPSEPSGAAITSPAAAAESGSASALSSTPPLAEPKIGNTTNPWCRFCPDPPAGGNK